MTTRSETWSDNERSRMDVDDSEDLVREERAALRHLRSLQRKRCKSPGLNPESPREQSAGETPR